MGRKVTAKRRALHMFIAGKKTRKAHGKSGSLMSLRQELVTIQQRRKRQGRHIAMHEDAKKRKLERQTAAPEAVEQAIDEDGEEDDEEDGDDEEEEEEDDDEEEEEEDDDDEDDGDNGQGQDEEPEEVDLPAGVDAQLVGYYGADKDTLLVGEGNLSFAAALLLHFGGRAPKLTATVFDSEDVLRQKYDEAAANAAALVGAEACLLYNVDGTKLDQNKKLSRKQFDTIAFHFPHVGAGIKDQDRNVESNQNMLAGFFKAAKPILRPHGLVHVTLRRGMPYDLWKVPFLARACGLELVNAVRFDPRAFPGYAHRRTIGAVSGISAIDNEEIINKRCVTYVFGQAETVAKAKALMAKKHRQQMVGSNNKKKKLRIKQPSASGRGSDDDD